MSQHWGTMTCAWAPLSSTSSVSGLRLESVMLELEEKEWSDMWKATLVRMLKIKIKRFFAHLDDLL